MTESPVLKSVSSVEWCGSAQLAPKQISEGKLLPVAPSAAAARS